MADKSKIEWTEATWNPLAGCTKLSAGCKFCYAIKDATRLAGNNNPKIAAKYAGTVKDGNWTGEINLAADDVLLQPLRWNRPRRIFVNSMSDLFHESVPDAWIQRIFAVMASAPQHTFQILTKRASRMHDFVGYSQHHHRVKIGGIMKGNHLTCIPDQYLHTWPLPNVWLGVSVEDQAAADERIPHLLDTPAAVRWLSCEPLIAPVELQGLRKRSKHHLQASVDGMIANRAFSILQDDDGRTLSAAEGKKTLLQMQRAGVKYIKCSDDCDSFDDQTGCPGHSEPALDWVVVGGESGQHARPCNITWIERIVDQCKSAGVPVFVKQLGTGRVEYGYVHYQPTGDGKTEQHGRATYLHKKGADISEWPESIRVREMPEVTV